MADRGFQAIVFAVCAAMLGVPALADEHSEDASGPSLPPTVVRSETDAQRLLTVQGVTLQWIGWEERGDVRVSRSNDGHWWLTGAQEDESGAGLRLKGFIMEIGEDYFLFDGRIEITDAPSKGRFCDEHKIWRFEATQRRAYYRLREFEWCDGLTDYIDIYFAPGLR